tara:strand:- start:6230 stop:6937 length:708 start_codon:yes stop_codon:yes gene_type:complete
MIIKLNKKPKGVIIIEGFPGFGLIGTIATEFLIDHLKTEFIGNMWLEDLPPIATIHQSKIIEPLGIHYNKKYNLVLIHGITGAKRMEWKIADGIAQIAKMLSAKMIISLEGIGSPGKKSTNLYYYSSDPKLKKQMDKHGMKLLKEGIIVGVTGALLLKREKLPMSCIFAETASNLPDSRAAAKVIEALDKIFGFNIDSKPLIKQAKEFEVKLKALMKGTQQAQKQVDKKQLDYFG